ncbi:MAG: hypothetical protein KC620_15640 [Myxococcales bacterium]|nr:hypothetical protein [Myxococcales bacterium]
MRSLALALALLVAVPAHAQAPEREAEIPYQQAIDDDYQPRPKDDHPGSLGGTLLAIVPGVLVRGLGHFAIDENRSAVLLLLTELASLALIIGGSALGNATHQSGEVGAVGDVLTHAGVMLFVGSWVADIIGAYTGTSPFEPDSSRVDGNMFGVAYRYTDNPLDPYRHHIVTRLDLRAGPIYVRPLVDIEVGLDRRLAKVDIGGHVWRGDDPHNHVSLGLQLRRREDRRDGFAVNGALGYIEWKADVGPFIRSLRHFYILNRTGYAVDGYQFNSTPDSVPALFADAEFYDTWLLTESGVGVNTGERTHMTLLITQNPDGDISPVSPIFGLLRARLEHRYADDVDIEFELTWGDGFAIWLGLGYGL